MALEELISRAKREFSNYVLIDREMSAVDLDVQTRPLRVGVARHPFQHHDHVFVVAEDLEGVLGILFEPIETELREVKRVHMISRRHGVNDLQADSNFNVFTKVVYAFTRFRPSDWAEAQALYAERGWRLILRDNEFEDAFLKGWPYDVFICHCSEDKVDVARPLAKELFSKNVRAWIDEMCLLPGDSLIDRIDKALNEVPLGVVVISPTFLKKRGWTNREFRSLATKELIKDRPAIIPIWHNVTRTDVAEYSLELADKVALKTSEGIEKLGTEISRVVIREKEQRRIESGGQRKD